MYLPNNNKTSKKKFDQFQGSLAYLNYATEGKQIPILNKFT